MAYTNKLFLALLQFGINSMSIYIVLLGCWGSMFLCFISATGLKLSLSPVHGVNPEGVLAAECLLHAQSSNGPDVLDGVHCHHPGVLQGLLVAGNVPVENLALEDSTHDYDRDDGNHEQCHDPRVHEGNDERKKQRREGFNQ